MKILKTFLFGFSILFLCLLFSFGTRALVVEEEEIKPVEVSSYELFWPIVAGRVSGDTLYPLKLFKEKIRGLFILSKTKKSEYHLFLSEKRIVEFEKLALTNKDQANGAKTLKAARGNHEKVVLYFNKAKVENVVVTATAERIINSFNNQVLLLGSIMNKTEGNQKEAIKEVILYLNSEVDRLR